MSRLTNTTNIIMKIETLVKTTHESFTFEDDTIYVSPMLIDRLLKFCSKSGN